MLRTNCTVNGRTFPLKYQKIFSKNGYAFQGIIFLKHVTGFTYTRRNDNTTLFEPSFLDANMQKSIIRAIEANKEEPEKIK